MWCLPLARLVLCALAAVDIAGCCCPPSEKTTQPGPTTVAPKTTSLEPALIPIVRGYAAFLQRKSDMVPRFHLRGTHSCIGNDPSQITVESIDIYGASGRWGSDEVAKLQYKLASVPPPAQRKWELKPRDWQEDKLKWDGGEAYTLLVRYTYTVTELGIPSSPRTADRLGIFDWIEASPAVRFEYGEPKPGDTIKAMRCSGTFFGAQYSALYDVYVAYDSSAGHTPTQLEVFAAANDPGTGQPPAGFPRPQDRLGDAISLLSNPVDISVTGLQGRYINGRDSYSMVVRVTYTSAPLTDEQGGSFTDILHNLGNQILLPP